MERASVFITGASAGIGLALARQLLADHNCRVFLGARSTAKGAAALASLTLPPAAFALATVVECDTTSDASVAAAASAVREALGGAPLYALVNNAGVGAAAGVDAILETNFRGPMRAARAFLPLLGAGGRMVNVGSGSGPSYVKALLEAGEAAAARELVCAETLATIEAHVEAQRGGAVSEKAGHGYGLSKAALHAFTQVFAKEHPGLIVMACSPGFINTALTQGYGA